LSLPDLGYSLTGSDGARKHPDGTARRESLISPRFTCPSCGESFEGDLIEVACPKCGNSQVRPAPGERFSEDDRSGSTLAEALNENLRRLKATLKER